MGEPHPTSRRFVRHAIARARGVRDGTGCACVLCGDSPFDAAGRALRALGTGFSDWSACDAPRAVDLCAGCATLLAGRPGQDPPPLRTRNVALIEGTLRFPDHAEMWLLLTTATPGLSVLSWATSKQKHHLLFAERCSEGRVVVGSDYGPIRLDLARDAPLIQALLVLRAQDAKDRPWFTRDEVATGSYRPQQVARNPVAWTRAEEVCARRRGSLPFLLYLHHAPSVAAHYPVSGEPMIDPIDEVAASLLTHIARDSAVRREDGIMFWRALFARRITRHAGRPVAEAVSRLFADLQVPPSSPGAQAAVAAVTAFSPEDAEAVSRSLKSRTSLLVALAFDRTQAAKATRTPTDPESVT